MSNNQTRYTQEIFYKKTSAWKVKANALLIAGTVADILAMFAVILCIWVVVHLGGVLPYGALFLTGITFKIGFVLAAIYLGLDANNRVFTQVGAARFIDRYLKDRNDTLQNATEFALNPAENSPQLLQRIFAMANKVSWYPAPPKRLWQNKVLVLALAVAGWLAMVLWLPGSINSMGQFLRPSMPAPQHAQHLAVNPGNTSLVRSSNLRVDVLEPETGVEYTLYRQQGSLWRQQPLKGSSAQLYNIDAPFKYYVKSEWGVSDTFNVQVFDKPVITSRTLHYTYPHYTGLKPETQTEADQGIRALAGTKVVYRFTANNPLQRAKLSWQSDDSLSVVRVSKTTFQAEFNLTNSGYLALTGSDFLGNALQDPPLKVTAVADQPPTIEFVHPAADTLLNQNMLTPLTLVAADDYGLQNLKLFWEFAGKTTPISLQQKFGENLIDYNYMLDLNTAGMLPGDVAYYWAEISDNSPQKQKGASRRWALRFPSIEEIYKQIEQEDQQRKEGLQNSLTEARELQEKVEEKKRDLINKKQLDWQDKKDVKELVDKQDELSKQVQELARDYQKTIDKLQNNDALSQQTMDKLKQVQELMEEINTPELQEAMQKMNEAIQKMDPDMMKKALADYQFSLEDFTQKLDSTIKLLEQIKKEQALEQTSKAAQEMLETQTQLNEDTKSGQHDSQSLQQRQQQVQQMQKDLQDRMQEAAQTLSDEADSTYAPKMQEIAEQMEQSGMQQDLSQSEQQLGSNQQQQAQGPQQAAQQKMEQTSKQLSELSEQFSAGGMGASMEGFDQAITALLHLSYLHQNNAARYHSDPFAILSRQVALYEGVQLTLTKLYQVPFASMFVSPKFVLDTRFTLKSWQQMFSDINDAQNSKVSSYLSDIQKGLNLMIYDLMQSMNNMQSGGGGGGAMQQFMQQMQQMGQQQMMMNSLTQSLFEQMMQQQQQKQGLSHSQRQELNRLAGQEERLAQNMARLLQGNSEAQKQAAALDKMIKDLREIAQKMRRGQLDRQLLQRQEKILSRMLESEKSMQERDKSKKRKAESATRQDWDLPPEVKERFRDLRRKALLQENLQAYPPRWRELIRKYLQDLNAHTGGNNE